MPGREANSTSQQERRARWSEVVPVDSRAPGRRRRARPWSVMIPEIVAREELELPEHLVAGDVAGDQVDWRRRRRSGPPTGPAGWGGVFSPSARPRPPARPQAGPTRPARRPPPARSEV